MTALVLALAVFQDPAARVADLAPELEAKDLARVFRAVGTLAELGPAAAPLLEARAGEAAEGARPYFLLAADEARRSPSLPDRGRSRRFTITYAPQDLGLLVHDFQRRTGARFSLDGFGGEELPDVGVELKEATFAEALLAISRAAKMTPRRDSGVYSFQPAPVDLPMFAYAGYLMYLDSFTQRRIVDFRGPARSRITLDLEVIWDPAVRLVSAAEAVVTAAVDDQGRPLTPPAPEEDPGEAPSLDSVDFIEEGLSSIELSGPAGGVATIALLRGYVPVQIEKASVALSLPKPAPGAGVKTGGFELLVRKWKADEGALEIEVSRPGGKPEELRKMPLSVTVYDLSGERVATSVGLDRSADALKVSVYCDLARHRGLLPAAPNPDRPRISKLEVSVATECLERRVPFEFRDLKLR